MPDQRDAPVLRRGDELRRIRSARSRSRRHGIAIAVAALAAGAALATAWWAPRPLLVWNATASSPVGLYGVAAPSRIGRGDMVIAWAPPWARTLAGDRRYLPPNVPLVKRVAAAAGDQVCAAGEAVFVNGRLEAHRRDVDEAGRPLPWWNGCVDLSRGQLFLLMAGSPDSFDGRYFGLSERREIIGRARLLWAR